MAWMKNTSSPEYFNLKLMFLLEFDSDNSWLWIIISREMPTLRNQIQVKCDIKSFLLSTRLTTDVSKSSLLQNVGNNFLISVDCSVPSYKEMIGMKVAMFASFHNRLKPVDLRWIFTKWIFLIKEIFLFM